MKKIFMGLSLFVICICLCGCNGSVTRDIRHAGFTINSEEFVCSKVMPKDKDDTSYSKIKFMLGSYLILDDGSLYDLSLSQQYSNKQNCRVSETDKKVVSIFDQNYFKSSDDRFYYLSVNGDTKLFSVMTDKDNSYNLVKLFLGDATNVKVITADSSSGSYYVLKTDGNIYNIVVSKDKSNIESIISTKIVYNKNDYDSKIIDFNYAGDSLNTYIKTENKMYRMKITNSEECSKYADISCKFELQKDEIFEKYKDRIIFFNGSILITDYGKTFNVSE